MDVFISHITEESDLAICFKIWIEKLFLGNYSVFVSSDKDSIPLGTKWLEGIDNSLSDCKVIILLCSPKSIKRPWINFEAGCGWIKKIPVIPICHSGLKLQSLPFPIGFLQGVDLSDDTMLERLLKSLSDKLGVKIPPLVHIEMQQELRKIEASLQSDTNEYLVTENMPSEQLELDEADCLNILDTWFMSIAARERERAIIFSEVDRQLNLPNGVAKRFVKEMAAKRHYVVQNEGANTITFKHDLPRIRMAAFI